MPQEVEHSNKLLLEVMGWPSVNPTLSLLQALDQTGSINSAANALGIQYKSAWQQLDRISNMLPYPLVEKKAGGKGGGGSVLTVEGKQLLIRTRRLQKEFSRFMQDLTVSPNETFNTIKIIRRMEMQLSARNVWLGKVVSIDKGVVNSVVNVTLKGGDKISSVITDHSVSRLGLEPGVEIMTVVKASSVLLGTGVDPQELSARNILTGIISRIIPGGVNDEVVLDLPGGSTVTSIITSASVSRLELAVNKEISAIIKASDVLLATA